MSLTDQLDNDLNIPQELRDIIEDSEDEETAMPLRFNDPDELSEIFSTLEEQNLFMINICQEYELHIEKQKQQEKEIKHQFSQEVAALTKNKDMNDLKIKKTEAEKNALGGITDDTEGKSLEPSEKRRLDTEVANLYRTAKTKNEKDKDKSVEQKINNSTALTLIEESEYILNKFLDEFKYIESHYQTEFLKAAKDIRTTKRKEIREETKRETEKLLKIQ